MGRRIDQWTNTELGIDMCRDMGKQVERDREMGRRTDRGEKSLDGQVKKNRKIDR